MIEISRSLIKQFRAVLRKSAWQHVRRGGLCPVVEFIARPTHLTIRSQLNNVAIAYCAADAHETETLRVPATALEDFEGRGQARVSLAAIDNDRVLARWDEAGARHEKTYDLAEAVKPSELPKPPARFTDNAPSILKALHDAMESTASDNARYAVHNVQLRGTGQIVGTDCHQLLVQGGFQLPWKGDVFVPRVTVFCQDFGKQTSVGVARIDDHVCFRIGAWTIWLPIDKDGRFPKYENIVPQMADNNYGSRGASINIELELDSSLIGEPAKFQEKIKQVYGLARSALNDELNNGHGTNGSANGNSADTPANGNGAQKTNGQRQRPATQSQVKAIHAIANNQRLDLGQYLNQHHHVNRPEDLDIKSASQVIDSLKRQEGGH